MFDECAIDHLVESNVVVERDDGKLGLAPRLVSAIDDREGALADADASELRDVIRSACAPDVDVDAYLNAVVDDDRRAARFLAIRSRTDHPPVDCLRFTLLVERFERLSPAASGAPAGFLPLHGDQVPLALAVTRRAIVYVWRDECDPCDVMRAEFEDAFGPTGDDELGLYAVSGPDAATFLYDRYGVAGAPTTLFVVDAMVDCRLEGAHYRSVIDSEIDTLRDVST